MQSLESSTIIDHTTVNCAMIHTHKMETDAISGSKQHFTIKFATV